MNPDDLKLRSPLTPPPPFSHWYAGQTTERRAEAVNEHGENLKKLINDALAVQDGLNTVKNQLAHLDSAENTVPLTSLALDCQEVSNSIHSIRRQCYGKIYIPINDQKFYDLLTSSRDSASILMAHLEGNVLVSQPKSGDLTQKPE
jgi:hypothetical protein